MSFLSWCSSVQLVLDIHGNLEGLMCRSGLFSSGFTAILSENKTLCVFSFISAILHCPKPGFHPIGPITRNSDNQVSYCRWL